MLEAAIIQQIPAQSDLKMEEKIFIRAFTLEYGENPRLPSKEQLQKVFGITRRDFQDPNFYFYHALHEEKPIGFIAFHPTENVGEVHIGHLAIDPNFQGKGFGKRLLFTILEVLPETKKLVLITRKENHGSRAFYKRLGFIPSIFYDDDYDMEAFIGLELAL